MMPQAIRTILNRGRFEGMEGLRSRLILAALAGGMLMLFFEVRFSHRFIAVNNWYGKIPIVFALVALVACLLAMVENRRLRLICAVVLALGVPIGLFGLYQHTEGEVAALTEVLKSENKDSSRPPAFAPMGLAGLGLIGALIAWPTRKS